MSSQSSVNRRPNKQSLHFVGLIKSFYNKLIKIMIVKSIVSLCWFRPANFINLTKFPPVFIHNFYISTKVRKVNCIKNNNITPILTYRTKTGSKEYIENGETKAKLILNLNFQSTEDALPFYKLPIRTLTHIYKTTKKDQELGFCSNRLYYIASRIQVPPAVLSEKLAKRTFIYSLSFEWIKKALDVLLEMGISSERILRDLWVLKYHHETIHERLQRVRNMGIEQLFPWMVRCSENILNRFICISQETKNILGDYKSTQIYLANRLNTSLEAVDEMCLKVPALKTIRVTKVKNFLDFLITEGFKVEDIANKPRVLSSSQKTVSQRLNKLRELGQDEINLNILCRSKKDFRKYCESLESLSEENKKT